MCTYVHFYVCMYVYICLYVCFECVCVYNIFGKAVCDTISSGSIGYPLFAAISFEKSWDPITKQSARPQFKHGGKDSLRSRISLEPAI